MRVSTFYQYDSFTNAIDQAAQSLSDAQQQVSSGKKLNQPSDDPFATTSVLQMSSLVNGLTQYSKNLTTAKGSLGVSENALSEASSLINQAYTLALSGANASTDQAGLQAMANQIQGIETRLVQLANSQGASGQYVFGGQKNSATPFTVAGGAFTFNGDTNMINVEGGPNTVISSTVDASAAFTTIYSQLETLRNNLLSGNTNALSGTSVTDMQNAQQSLNAIRGDIGSKLQTISDLTSQNSRRSDDFNASISNLRDIDATDAIAKYQSALTAYQAALTVANAGFHLSVMDYLKL